MSKKFTVLVPDEPFKDSLTQNKSVEVTYDGPRFLVITYDPNTNEVKNVDGYFNTREEIDLSMFADDRYSFAIIDTNEHTLESALLTNYYTNDEIDPYTETLVTGEEFVFHYSNNGILEDLYNRWELKYFPETGKFEKLNYQKFPTSKEFFMESLTNTIAVTTSEKAKAAEEGATEEELAKYDHVIEWCQNFEETYGDTDFWKIPFPTVK